MTDKEKLEKIKSLADKMYSRMAYLTSDTRPIRQAMDEYHQFIINEYHKEEPKECMYSKDNYTDEDRKVLCEGCEEDCRFNKKEESVSKIIFDGNFNKSWYAHPELAFKAGMQEMREQMMAKAVDVTVHIDAGGYPYIPQMELYDYEKDIPLAEEGDKYKVILIKED